MSSPSAAAKANVLGNVLGGVVIILMSLVILAAALAGWSFLGKTTPLLRAGYSLIALMMFYGGLKLTGVL